MKSVETFRHEGYILRLLLLKNGFYYLYAENTNIKSRRVYKRWTTGTKKLDLARDMFCRKKLFLQEHPNHNK